MTVCCTCTLLCKLFLSGFQPCCIAEHVPLSQVEVFLKCRKCYSGPRVCQVAYWMSTLREQVLNKITFFFLLKRTTVWWTIIFVRSINRYFTPKKSLYWFFFRLCVIWSKHKLFSKYRGLVVHRLGAKYYHWNRMPAHQGASFPNGFERGHTYTCCYHLVEEALRDQNILSITDKK